MMYRFAGFHRDSIYKYWHNEPQRERQPGLRRSHTTCVEKCASRFDDPVFGNFQENQARMILMINVGANLRVFWLGWLVMRY